ncbi:hypothetical protein SAMN02745146_2287 [Hymenobacter daecheongensis DSM 21074]|uniref:HTH cro/C1-type domain-containing protein n=1 Tax=Hymenobacter daecheongensis DSM 21074 TaxID=1121955 RepID=A0A1M6GJJ5_9BACT|nr:helix-turn-helix transcriptional regulator [Hymenobacter daecheongensis]SHJ10145.1 hypothetical protein SAMN02745146_2287 [Hymenobacter daecheongensis DSM 21074]
MPRRSRTATNLLVRLRTWFGLDQEALALYLGASPALIRSIETGRRTLTTNLLQALLPLMQQLPPADVPAAPLPPGMPAPEAAELDFRRRVCQQQLARFGRELAALEERGRVAGHWAQALPALQQEAAASAPATAAEAERQAWLSGWLTRQARPLPPEASTRWHLLRARVAALTAELATLAEATGGAGA